MPSFWLPLFKRGLPKGLKRPGIHHGAGGVFLLAYLDDYAGSEPLLEQALQSYSHFMEITKSLGLQLALKKCVKPTRKIEWLGYLLDADNMTLAIPQQKLDEAHW